MLIEKVVELVIVVIAQPILGGSATDATADCSAALNDNSCTPVKPNAKLQIAAEDV